MMAPMNNQQLVSLITALTTELQQVIQMLNSCNTTILFLIDKLQENNIQLQSALNERNRSLMRFIRARERYITRNPRLYHIEPGRSDIVWGNILNDRTPAHQWHKNFRMNKETFMKLVDLLAPYLNPDPNSFRRDSLTAAKK